MTPFRMRLSVAAFLAIATAISINALYLQAPFSRERRTGHGPQPPSGAAARARALITAALPGHEGPAKSAIERQEKPATAPAVTMPAKEKAASEPPKPVKLEPSPVVRALQKKLLQFGYHGLPQDGCPIPETRAAILAAEFEEGMPLSGEPGDAILKGLFFLEASGKTRLASTERFEADKALVQEVQDLLAKLGYSSGPVDGQVDTKTREAIRKFEADRRLKPDGRLASAFCLKWSSKRASLSSPRGDRKASVRAMRIKAGIWVSAYLRRMNAMAIPALVARRGDADAGAIFIKLNTLDGFAQLLRPAASGIEETADERLWTPAFNAPLAERDVDAYLARQREFDGDMWIIEVEDRGGRHFLDDVIAAS